MTALLSKQVPVLWRVPFCAFILLVANSIFLMIFAQTHANQYANDAFGHMDYVLKILEDGAIPAPKQGWVTYHPFPYYALAALFYKALEAFGVPAPFEIVRLTSLLLMNIFFYYGLKTLALVSADRSWRFFAVAAMVVWWPAGMIYANRIDSHLLYYALYGAGFYYFIRWWQCRHHEADWHKAMRLAGLALAVRTNALVLLAVVGGGWALGWFKGHVRLRQCFTVAFLMSVLVVAAAAGVNFGRSAYYGKTKPQDMVVMNFSGNTKNLLDDPPLVAFTPDFSTYAGVTPFFQHVNDDSGKRNFWNSVMKSSLFGEYRWKPEALAYAMLYALLALWGVVFATLPLALCKRHETLLPLLLGWCVPLLASAVFRWMYPASTSQDFRYIYPAIVAFCGIYLYGVEQLAKAGWPRVANALTGLSFSFATMSVAFFAWHFLS